MSFSGVLRCENIIKTSQGSCFVEKMAVCLQCYPQTIQNKMVICPYGWKYARHIYGNGLAVLDSLVMCTVYNKTITFDQLKLRLGL